MRLHSGLQNVVLAMALCAPSIRAQQEGPVGTQAPQGSTSEAPPDSGVNAPVPDTRPLSGAEEITVGTRGRARNYVLPSLQVTAYGDSNRFISSAGTSKIEMVGTIVGRLAAQRVTRTNQLTMDYMGGGLLYARESDLNATMHEFGFTENWKGRRWGLMLGDRVSYLPESPFGFYGFGSPGLGAGGFGTNLGQLNPMFTPNQSILSGRGSRVSNTTVAQVEYDLSARSAFTATASYGLLRFQESGPIDSDHRIYTAGYSYMVTRRDTVAISYGFSQFRFKGVSVGFDNHFVQLSYGRRVTGRLAFELAGGPQFDVFRNPTTGSDQRVSWNAHSSLRYRLRRTDVGFSYGHYTTSGSGVLFGAQTDQINGSIGWRLSRNWSGSLNPGYAHNNRLAQTTAQGVSVSYDSIHAGFRLYRALGRYMDMSFNYSVQDQRSSSTGQEGINGGNVLVRHVFGFGFNWHTRRIEVD